MKLAIVPLALALGIPATTLFNSATATTEIAVQTTAPCDSSSVIGQCRATITKDGNWAQITSSTDQCSIVDWYLGAQPQTTVIRGGLENVELLLGSAKEDVRVANCRIVETLDSADYSKGREDTLAERECGAKMEQASRARASMSQTVSNVNSAMRMLSPDTDAGIPQFCRQVHSHSPSYNQNIAVLRQTTDYIVQNCRQHSPGTEAMTSSLQSFEKQKATFDRMESSCRRQGY